MVVFQDRVPRYPGRVTMTPVSGQANTYDLARADEPSVEGTKINAAFFESFMQSLQPPVGDIKITVRTDLGDNWLLCNGTPIVDDTLDTLISLIKQKPNYTAERAESYDGDRDVYIPLARKFGKYIVVITGRSAYGETTAAALTVIDTETGGTRTKYYNITFGRNVVEFGGYLAVAAYNDYSSSGYSYVYYFDPDAFLNSGTINTVKIPDSVTSDFFPKYYYTPWLVVYNGSLVLCGYGSTGKSTPRIWYTAQINTGWTMFELSVSIDSQAMFVDGNTLGLVGFIGDNLCIVSSNDPLSNNWSQTTIAASTSVKTVYNAKKMDDKYYICANGYIYESVTDDMAGAYNLIGNGNDIEVLKGNTYIVGNGDNLYSIAYAGGG